MRKNESDRLAKQALPLLPAGTHVRFAFMCQRAPRIILLINYLTYAVPYLIQYRVVCVADDAIYVLRGSKFTVRPLELLAKLPRETKLGPLSGGWGEIKLPDGVYWVHERFHDGINSM